MTQNTPIEESHSWAFVCHLLKFTPLTFSGFIASAYLDADLDITKCLSGFWNVGNNCNLVMINLIPRYINITQIIKSM
jgi:hypothetical protein